MLQTQPSSQLLDLANQLFNYCIQNEAGEGLTSDLCFQYLTYFNNDTQKALSYLYSYPKEIYLKTGISISLGRRILQDCNFDLNICQSRIDQIVKLSQNTFLNFEFSWRCLAELNWNFERSMERVNELRKNGQIPEHCFRLGDVKTEIKQESDESIVQNQQPPVIASSSKKQPIQNTDKDGICQHDGCTNPIEPNRKKYCEIHAYRPLKSKSMQVDYVKCQHESCTQPIEKGRKKYCKLHGKSRK